MFRIANLMLLIVFLTACNYPGRQPTRTTLVSVLVSTPVAPETSPFTPLLTPTPTKVVETTEEVLDLATPGIPPGIENTPLVIDLPITVNSLQMFDLQNGWGTLDANSTQVSGHLLRTVDGGKTWQQVTPPAGYPQGSLLYALDPQQAWSASAYSIPGESALAGYIWRTTNGGASWQPSAAISLVVEDQELVEGFLPQALFFLDNQQGWLVASVGHYMNQDVPEIFSTQDGGLTWHRLADKASMGQGEGQDGGAGMPCHVSGIAFVDAQHGFLAGDCLGVSVDDGFSILISTNGGRSWQVKTLPEPVGLPQAVKDAEAAAERFCAPTGVGLTPAGLLVQHTCQVLEGSGMLKNHPFLSLSADGGTTWLSWVGENASFVNSSDGYSLGILGQDGTRQISVTANGGKDWQTAGTVSWLEAWLEFAIPGQGFALARSWNQQSSAYEYALVRTENSAQSWALVKGVVK